jgi:hypothetical protein
MKKKNAGFILTTGIILLGIPAFSAVIDSGLSGLSAPVTTVTFTDPAFPDTTPVSDEYSLLGVAFSPNLYYRGTSLWEDQGINGPNLRTGDPVSNPFSIHFSNPITSAAFASIASPVTQATITARLSGVDVESFTTEINLVNESWYGFTDIVFDEIGISYVEDTRLRIDNIQIGAAVPEPSTVVLATLGLLAIARRRRSR